MDILFWRLIVVVNTVVCSSCILVGNRVCLLYFPHQHNVVYIQIYFHRFKMNLKLNNYYEQQVNSQTSLKTVLPF